MATSIAASTIAQQAFRFMEIAPLSSFADTTPQAQAAAEQYPVALDECLEEEDWSFARVLVMLPPAELSTEDAPGRIADADLPHSYRLPGDCVKVRHVHQGVLWRIDGGDILTTQSGGLKIRYTRRITNEARLPAKFRTAVAYKLAHLLAPEFVKHRTKRDTIEQNFETQIRKAVKADAKTASTGQWSDAAGADWAAGATR